MNKCEQCGNESTWTFELTLGGITHTFDSFECAIFAMAAACGHCGCRILGHPIQEGDRLFCCHHCAQSFDNAMAAGSDAS